MGGDTLEESKPKNGQDAFWDVHAYGPEDLCRESTGQAGPLCSPWP